MDAADHAQALEEMNREHALARAKAAAKKPQAKGYCRYCTEPFPDDAQRVFCDHECAGEAEKFGLS